MARGLFGTDGVRGLAGIELTASLALGIGAAAARQAGAQRPRALVIRDTRESGPMLQAAIAAGIASAGGEVLIGGILPTPAAPLLVRRYALELGVVISASHNPYAANGIKIFGRDGFKLSDELEQAIEAELASERAVEREPAAIGLIGDLDGAREDYLRELHVRFGDLQLTGMKVALDCANGATHAVAPEIFRRLGAEVSVIADAPDGRNINDRCGSTHLTPLVELMRGGEHQIGFAFDGDGDRVMAVDRTGAVVDGDELLALIALHMHGRGRLTGGGVAVTVMSNYGFHAAMQERGISVVQTKVGDRNVLQELRSRGWVLGGEQSGHIIELGFNPSGDGIASALLTLESLRGADLAERDAMQRLPQRLLNVPVLPGRGPLDAELAALPVVEEEVRRASELLAGRGRVLVRASGTEPLLRVMVEAPTEQEAGDLCSRLAALLERELGSRGD